jgi:hypothetical protein
MNGRALAWSARRAKCPPARLPLEQFAMHRFKGSNRLAQGEVSRLLGFRLERPKAVNLTYEPVGSALRSEREEVRWHDR